jgi:hypothetical protein
MRRTDKVMVKREKEKDKELQHCIENLIEQQDLQWKPMLKSGVSEKKGVPVPLVTPSVLFLS